MRMSIGLLSFTVAICILYTNAFISTFSRKRSVVNMSVTTKSELLISNLRLSAMSRQVDAQLVTESIDKLEKLSSNDPISLEIIKGEWELVFSSLIGGGYFPILELVDFFGFKLDR